MAETRTTNKRKMADRRGEADSEKTSNWPSIKPKKNLQLTPPKDTNLFTVQNFLTSAESNAFVKAAESMRFVHQGSLGPTKGEAYRDNDRISVNDPVLADTIWESGLNKLFSDIIIRGRTAVGLNRISDSIETTVGEQPSRCMAAAPVTCGQDIEIPESAAWYLTVLVSLV
ncbi:hypothetical protein COP2_001925 [Malus domestica]